MKWKLALGLIYFVTGCETNVATSDNRIYSLDKTIGVTRQQAKLDLFANGTEQLIFGRFAAKNDLSFDGVVVACANKERAAALKEKYADEIAKSLRGETHAAWIARAQSAGEFGWELSVSIADTQSEIQASYEGFKVADTLKAEHLSGKCGYFYISLSPGGLHITDQVSIASGIIWAEVVRTEEYE